MSDDNVYEFNDNEQSAFDIPDSTVDEGSNEHEQEQEPKQEAQEQEQETAVPNSETQTPTEAKDNATKEETPEEENDDEEYDPSETKTIAEDSKEVEKVEDEDDLYASEDEDRQNSKPDSSTTSNTTPSQESSVTESSTKLPKEKKKVSFLEPEKDSKQDEDNEEDEDSDYDPTADVSESLTTSSNPTISNSSDSNSNSISTSINPLTNADNNLQSYASKIMSSNLLSDPEFLKLSDSEKQQRILEELKSPTPSNNTSLASSSYNPLQSYNNNNTTADHRPNLRIPMNNDEIAKYNLFVDNEAKYSTSRHTPAPNSRLFVGNLPSNSISKQDLFRLFSRYGTILQISLKGSYGFIQFTDAQAVEKAIEVESQLPLNGKDLMLQIAKNSKPGSNDSTFDRKRGREEFNDYNNDRPNSRRKKDIECKILVKKNADPGYTKEVNRQFHSANINSEYEFLKPHMVLKEKTNEAAYGGCLGVVLINRNRTCDVQTYERTSDGSIKFDEYLGVTSNEATELLLRAKQNQYNNNGNSNNNRSGFGGLSQGGFQQAQPPLQQPPQQQTPFFGQQQSNFYQPPQQQQAAPPAMDPQQLLQSLTALGPNALQNLMAIAQGQQPQPQQPQQPPFQNPYQQFSQPQQPPATNPSVNLASLLGQVSQQQPNQSQFPYSNSNTYQQSQVPTQQFPQSQSVPTQSPPQNQAQPGAAPTMNIQELMANLQKFK
ncbi:Nuclear polyadenylated RNA-binding protein 3 [Wickerhamomyces ciferrii]|uniref:Nuclear polyadenylated RNA-binding protein 3 n=1 Tax=Wickerhamomyces ciferrii (strain ATCC 14091 / BCRC 22168 / CBS 111 / JCM 3599 / NBRC 0793 / NRRL Y-1031 F-60-10) TaxID=1206466 RepID=K0KWH2_WICCF|nr:Nuclear polyadenylated RNA-binding protein 3 [Wickerhamomyces ciferrii]CCH46332.1 Nuclear polyadenylated RNA-binding protein 3 [Wickerhamomyces ciferrii]